MKIVILAVCCLIISNTAMAGIYKCKANGKTIYSETPCAKESQNVQLELIDNKADARAWRNYQEPETDTYESTNTVEYMNQHDLTLRIRELNADINSITASREKIASSQTELGIMKRGRVKKLSYDDERRRTGLRASLNSLQESVRLKALGDLDVIYNKY